jgi:hypothetical protein
VQSASSALVVSATLVLSISMTSAEPASAAGEPRIGGHAAQQIAALLAEKAARSPAQQKIDSGLLRAIRENRGEPGAPGADLPPVRGVVDENGLVAARITAVVSDSLLKVLDALGARGVSAFAELREVNATLPAQKIEALAARSDVFFVTTRDEGAPASAYGLPVSEGDRTHKAFDARHTYGYDGTGVKIGVISDSVDFLTSSQLSGNLGSVTVVPGQSGIPGAGEGTAMLEIVHDLAPGASLYFASSGGSPAQMAANIATLRSTYGCDIIVDDWFFYDESPFQDGPVAQAVNAVTSGGGIYISAAQNDGNLDAGTSGTWEGDYANGGTLSSLPGGGAGGTVHDFGSGAQSALVTSGSGYRYALFWSDALGASSNDYDLFVLDSTLTNVLDSSTNVQSGTQDPYERPLNRYVTSGDRVVIFKHTAAASRFLHVVAYRGRLDKSTAGAVKGHAAAADAIATAATPASGPYPNPFTSSAVVETFSSDGPRRVFYQANGTAITPGNFSSTGGAVRDKPDLTAADGISTSIPAFTSYYGSSAAASHAAAIAALVKSANPALTAAQVKSTLTASAIDIMAAGWDRDSGNGVVMADAALASLAPTHVANLALTGFALVEAPGANGDGGVEPGESGKLTLTLTNGGAVTATGVSATLSLANAIPGVSITDGGPHTIGTGSIAAGASAANGTPFAIALDPGATCGQEIDLVVHVTFGSGAPGASPLALGLRIETGGPPLVISQTLDPTAPVSGTFYTASGGTQTGLLNANERVSACDDPKTTPGLATASGSRRYDAYTVTNGPADRCITVRLSSPCDVDGARQLFVAAYDATGFDPAHPDQHYLADAGVLTLGVDEAFSFTAPASAPYTVVVSEVNAGATNSQACAYTLTIDGPPCHSLSGKHGDANGDDNVDIADVFYLINDLFAAGPAPVGFGDSNGDGVLTIADVFYLINYLFASGPAPV